MWVRVCVGGGVGWGVAGWRWGKLLNSHSSHGCSYERRKILFFIRRRANCTRVCTNCTPSTLFLRYVADHNKSVCCTQSCSKSHIGIFTPTVSPGHLPVRGFIITCLHLRASPTPTRHNCGIYRDGTKIIVSARLIVSSQEILGFDRRENSDQIEQHSSTL